MIVAALAFASAASASTWPKDPRVCVPGATKTACAEAAAVLAVRKHLGGPGGFWQGPRFVCSRVSAKTMLKWSCPVEGAQPQTYAVVFTVTRHRWFVKVTP